MPRVEDLPPHLRAELDALAAMPDETIDVSDIPETTDFRGFGYRDFGRPADSTTPVSIDRDLLAWFRDHGAEDEPMAKRVNDALRQWVEMAKRKAA